MPGPTAWQQQVQVTNLSSQTITTTTETVVATLSGINSRSAGGPVFLTGSAIFTVQAATTAVTFRLRYTGLTGTQLASGVVAGGIAGDITNADGTLSATDTPAGEYAGMTYVLTVQATGAAANWNVTFASLVALL